MKQNVTIRNVAQHAGVSTSTVSRYLNSGYVDVRTSERIREAIGATGYMPSMMARGLKAQQSNIVVMIVPDIGNPFYSSMAKTVQHQLEMLGYVTVLLSSGEDVSREIAALDLARQMYASGIIISSINTCEHIARAPGKTPPIVLTSAYQESPAFDTVMVHHLGATPLSVRHLVELGHRRIAFAGGTPGSGIAEGRLNGFLRTMREENLPIDPALILQEGFTQEDGYRAGKYLAGIAERPTAVCCVNDLVALGVVHAFDDLGLRVPRDISVTGVDNIPYATIAAPELTTVTNDGELFGTEALRMLMGRINGTYAGEPRLVEIPNVLIVRESTAPPHPNYTLREPLAYNIKEGGTPL